MTEEQEEELENEWLKIQIDSLTEEEKEWEKGTTDERSTCDDDQD